MQALSIGDRVRLLDEAREGLVEALKSNEALVRFDPDFAEWVPVRELVQGQLPLEELTGSTMKEGSATPKMDSQRSETGLKEVDLHLGALLDFPGRLSASEALEFQLKTAKQALSDCRRARIPRLVLIHGVGEGVLRAKISEWLEGLEGVEYYDASYARYGRGATEVRIRRLG